MKCVNAVTNYISLPRCVFAAILVMAALAANRSQALTFIGTNAPGQGTNFSFTTTAGATNLSLVISNDATAYSYLLLKKGATPTDSDFDFASRLTGQTNQINLEIPEYSATNY